MAIPRMQIPGLAQTLIDGLVRADVVDLAANHDQAAAGIVRAFEKYGEDEEELGREAEKMAAEQLKRLGSEAIGIDRRQIVLMIKKKLAAQRGFPL